MATRTATRGKSASAKLDKAAKHGTIHRNKAARTKSRLAKAMRKAQQAAAAAPKA